MRSVFNQIHLIRAMDTKVKEIGWFPDPQNSRFPEFVVKL